MRVAAPRPNTLQPLQNSDQPSQRLVVEAIADFHPATVEQQKRQSARPIPSAHRTHGRSHLYLNQRAPHNTIVAETDLLLKLFLQMTVQRAQCHPMTAAELATSQTARPVRTCHTRNLRAVPTMNYHSSLSAHDNSPSQSRNCLLYTSDAADEEDSVDLGGRRIIKKKKK